MIPGIDNIKLIIAGVVVAGVLSALAYHYFTVSGLERDLATSELNYEKAKKAADDNFNTITMMRKDIDSLKEDRNISDASYISEISRLKGLIAELSKKPKYIEKIIVKPVQGECVINTKKLDANDSSNSIISIISTIGK